MNTLSAADLVRKTEGGIYDLSLRLTGNEADARDLAQDSLLKAVRALPAFRGDADPKSWVYRITVNTWKNRIQSRTWRWWDRLKALDGESFAEPGPEKSVELMEDSERLTQALDRLPPEERDAVVLREVEGKSYKEVAVETGVPIGTVKSRLSRGRRALKLAYAALLLLITFALYTEAPRLAGTWEKVLSVVADLLSR